MRTPLDTLETPPCLPDAFGCGGPETVGAAALQMSKRERRNLRAAGLLVEPQRAPAGFNYDPIARMHALDNQVHAALAKIDASLASTAQWIEESKAASAKDSWADAWREAGL